MKKQLLLIIISAVWTTSYQAVTVEEIVEDANNISLHTSPNIFEESKFITTLNNFRNDTNRWIEENLKVNKSDTLKKIYAQVKEETGTIVTRLKEFNSNLNLIKTNNQMLKTYKNQVRSFSKARDSLKNALNATKKFYAQNEKTVLRSQGRKDAKAEIANILGTYAERFIDIAQKAINDFARIDASLFDQEALKAKMKQKKPQWKRGEVPTEPIPAEEMAKQKAGENTWEDWDSDSETE